MGPFFGCCSLRQSPKAGRVFKAAHFRQRDLVAPVVGTAHGVTRCPLLPPMPPHPTPHTHTTCKYKDHVHTVFFYFLF